MGNFNEAIYAIFALLASSVSGQFLPVLGFPHQTLAPHAKPFGPIGGFANPFGAYQASRFNVYSGYQSPVVVHHIHQVHHVHHHGNGAPGPYGVVPGHAGALPFVQQQAAFHGMQQQAMLNSMRHQYALNNMQLWPRYQPMPGISPYGPMGHFPVAHGAQHGFLPAANHAYGLMALQRPLAPHAGGFYGSPVPPSYPLPVGVHYPGQMPFNRPVHFPGGFPSLIPYGIPVPLHKPHYLPSFPFSAYYQYGLLNHAPRVPFGHVPFGYPYRHGPLAAYGHGLMSPYGHGFNPFASYGHGALGFGHQFNPMLSHGFLNNYGLGYKPIIGHGFPHGFGNIYAHGSNFGYGNGYGPAGIHGFGHHPSPFAHVHGPGYAAPFAPFGMRHGFGHGFGNGYAHGFNFGYGRGYGPAGIHGFGHHPSPFAHVHGPGYAAPFAPFGMGHGFGHGFGNGYAHGFNFGYGRGYGPAGIHGFGHHPSPFAHVHGPGYAAPFASFGMGHGFGHGFGYLSGHGVGFPPNYGLGHGIRASFGYGFGHGGILPPAGSLYPHIGLPFTRGCKK